MGGEREKKRGKGNKTCRMYGCPGSSIVSGGTSRCNSAEKPKTMPNRTSANRAAITSLIDVFSLCFSSPHSRHVGRLHHNGGVDAVFTLCFYSRTPVILSSFGLF